jgi:hypothetical protein
VFHSTELVEAGRLVAVYRAQQRIFDRISGQCSDVIELR